MEAVQTSVDSYSDFGTIDSIYKSGNTLNGENKNNNNVRTYIEYRPLYSNITEYNII